MDKLSRAREIDGVVAMVADLRTLIALASAAYAPRQLA